MKKKYRYQRLNKGLQVHHDRDLSFVKTQMTCLQNEDQLRLRNKSNYGLISNLKIHDILTSLDIHPSWSYIVCGMVSNCIQFVSCDASSLDNCND